MTIRSLLLKTGTGIPIEFRDHLDLCVSEGIVGGVTTPPLRQILILSLADAR